MDPSQRIVTSMPLVELWDESGPVPAARKRDLGVTELRDMLRGGAVRFVVADAGSPLRWLTDEDRFSFWKSEVRPHLANPGQGAWHETFPDSYCYFGSEWADGSDVPIVVLEKSH
jgi:hypothetical protein